jgi:hemerythrin
MAHLEWNDDLNTGIEVIDNQHKQIIYFVNQLNDAAQTGDREKIAGVISGLVDYTLFHFSFEEELMGEADYEFLRPHKKVHEIFVRRVSEFRARFDAGEDVAIDLHAMLARWLINHIRYEDGAFAAPVKERLHLDEVSDQVEGDAEEKRGWFSRVLDKFFGG